MLPRPLTIHAQLRVSLKGTRLRAWNHEASGRAASCWICARKMSWKLT